MTRARWKRASNSSGEQHANTPSWAANAVRYEWLEEYGDVAPRHEALEKMLFNDKSKMEKGEQFKWGAARKRSFLGRQCGQV